MWHDITSNIALYSVLKTILYTKPSHCRCVIFCSYGCLERHSFSSAGAATLVFHSGVQILGVDATVKAEAVCCKKQTEHVATALHDNNTYNKSSCLSLEDVSVLYMHTKHSAMLISGHAYTLLFISINMHIATYLATLLW